MAHNQEDYFDVGNDFKKSVIIEVPDVILAALEYMASKTKNEYSIVLDAERIEGGYRLSETFRVPKQEVSTVEINYKEDIREKVVIHRHPDGNNRFSSVDEEFINQNFEISLLYTQSGGFVGGQVNIPFGDSTYIQVPTEIEVIAPNVYGKIVLPNKTIQASAGLFNMQKLRKVIYKDYAVDMSNISEIKREVVSSYTPLFNNRRESGWSYHNQFGFDDEPIRKYENGKDYILRGKKYEEVKTTIH